MSVFRSGGQLIGGLAEQRQNLVLERGEALLVDDILPVLVSGEVLEEEQAESLISGKKVQYEMKKKVLEVIYWKEFLTQVEVEVLSSGCNSEDQVHFLLYCQVVRHIILESLEREEMLLWKMEDWYVNARNYKGEVLVEAEIIDKEEDLVLQELEGLKESVSESVLVYLKDLVSTVMGDEFENLEGSRLVAKAIESLAVINIERTELVEERYETGMASVAFLMNSEDRGKLSGGFRIELMAGAEVLLREKFGVLKMVGFLQVIRDIMVHHGEQPGMMDIMKVCKMRIPDNWLVQKIVRKITFEDDPADGMHRILGGMMQLQSVNTPEDARDIIRRQRSFRAGDANFEVEGKPEEGFQTISNDKGEPQHLRDMNTGEVFSYADFGQRIATKFGADVPREIGYVARELDTASTMAALSYKLTPNQDMYSVCPFMVLPQEIRVWLVIALQDQSDETFDRLRKVLSRFNTVGGRSNLLRAFLICSQGDGSFVRDLIFSIGEMEDSQEIMTLLERFGEMIVLGESFEKENEDSSSYQILIQRGIELFRKFLAKGGAVLEEDYFGLDLMAFGMSVRNCVDSVGKIDWDKVESFEDRLEVEVINGGSLIRSSEDMDNPDNYLQPEKFDIRAYRLWRYGAGNAHREIDPGLIPSLSAGIVTTLEDPESQIILVFRKEGEDRIPEGMSVIRPDRDRGEDASVFVSNYVNPDCQQKFRIGAITHLARFELVEDDAVIHSYASLRNKAFCHYVSDRGAVGVGLTKIGDSKPMWLFRYGYEEKLESRDCFQRNQESIVQAYNSGEMIDGVLIERFDSFESLESDDLQARFDDERMITECFEFEGQCYIVWEGL